MPKGKVVKNVSIVDETEYNDTVNNGKVNPKLTVPLYTVKNALMSCKTYDEARAVFRENKPVNIKGTDGLFTTEVITGIQYKPIESAFNIATFDGDRIVITETPEFMGMTDKVIFVRDKDGKIRCLKKDISFFFTV